jgi:hypothetical protein
MSKRKNDADGDAPSAKLPSTSSVDYFSEHFCQNLPESFIKQLGTGNSAIERKIKLETIGTKHALNFIDYGFDLVSSFDSFKYIFSALGQAALASIIIRRCVCSQTSYEKSDQSRSE